MGNMDSGPSQHDNEKAHPLANRELRWDEFVRVAKKLGYDTDEKSVRVGEIAGVTVNKTDNPIHFDKDGIPDFLHSLYATDPDGLAEDEEALHLQAREISVAKAKFKTYV